MKPRIYIARALPEPVAAYLEANCECRYWQGPGSITEEELAAEIGDAEGVLLTGTPVGEKVLKAGYKLRVVSNLSAGYNNLDLSALAARRIVATHTPYVPDDTVADLGMTLILATARRVAELDRMVKEGRWRQGMDAELYGLDVHHKRLGIIGMGRIGEAVARRAAKGFDMDVVYYNRRRKPEAEERLGIGYMPLDELLSTSDFVLLLTPLTPQTRRLIGEKQLALMKRSAIFINISRGETVDEAALIRALETRRIAGAGLDVFEREPLPPDHPFTRMDHMVALPHIGSATAETRLNMAFAAARNLVRALTGLTPIDIVPELRA
ncbi:bifunctional glyoxylate/hydroxypyruvate reductase B [Paenibacillus cisolokensis]|uniref:Bifunctional glyoxylate/hydroxypyruvate reductase B n=1 Tax=Paenibacillus cisolokensis TaxID=1658519 RepID=A0ABQ4N615_9BACL|nr:D-glycerate dehydrogenase [Paenibacillus cisolokensis]GIQ63574.1 bifunctional glyoxylate/hydroxypyruvate reductase B [Paenibacillus cisolokensis]